MKHSDIALLMKAIAPTVGELVAGAVQPLAARIEELERQLAERPLPEKGDPYEPDPDQIKHLLSLIATPVLEEAISAIPEPKDGKSVTVEELRPLVEEFVAASVAEAVEGIPVPRDGKDGRDGVDGKDGVGLAGAFQNKDGHLILTLTNGATADVGEIAGRDGQDGAPGRDGADALGFDDLTVEHDGERGFAFKMQRGEQVKEFAFTVPVVIDRGVWNEGRAGGYAKGDGVTWAGSFWISQKDGNADKPDGGEGWRLAVKRGRDGRNAEAKAPAPKVPVKVG